MARNTPFGMQSPFDQVTQGRVARGEVQPSPQRQTLTHRYVDEALATRNLCQERTLPRGNIWTDENLTIRDIWGGPTMSSTYYELPNHRHGGVSVSSATFNNLTSNSLVIGRVRVCTATNTVTVDGKPLEESNLDLAVKALWRMVSDYMKAPPIKPPTVELIEHYIRTPVYHWDTVHREDISNAIKVLTSVDQELRRT